MRLLTIKIDGRVHHTINFDADRPAEDFVLQRSQARLDLLKFYRGTPREQKTGKFGGGSSTGKGLPVVCQTDAGETSLYVEKMSVAKLERQSGDTGAHTSRFALTVKLSEIPCECDTAGLVDGFGFDSGAMTVWHQDSLSSLLCVEVHFELAGMEAALPAVRLYASSGACIRDVVFDFGLESSQAAMFKRAATQYTLDDLVDLFAKMKSIYGREEDKGREDKEYWQFEADEKKKLYRSVFFVKQEMSFDEFNALKSGAEGKNDERALSVLSLRAGVEAKRDGGYMRMPNTKIITKGAEGRDVRVDDESRPVTELSQSCIRPFLRAIFDKIRAGQRFDGDTPCRLVALRMLVPNVYDHTKTVDTLRDIARFIRDKLLPSCPGIEAVEVSAVSESDASLMGLIKYDKTFPSPYRKGNYLILDAGKGTLDFSVVAYDGEKFTNKYRSGIVGAGNAISYGYFLGFLEQFIDLNVDLRGEKIGAAMRRFIYHAVLGVPDGSGDQWPGAADPAALCAIMEGIDSYKKGHRGGGVGVARSTKYRLEDVGLATVTTFIGNAGELDQRYLRYVDNVCDRLVDNVADKLSFLRSGNEGKGALQVDYLMFTGRAFGCKILADRMQARLMRDFGITKRLSLPEQKADGDVLAKQLCLFVAPLLSKGQYNHHIMSAPFCMDDAAEQGAAIPAVKRRKWSVSTLLREKLGKTISSIEFVQFGSSFSDAQQQQSRQNEDNDNPNVIGFKLSKGRGGQLNVAGVAYRPIDAQLLGDKGDFELFYVGRQILVRHGGQVADLSEVADLVLPDPQLFASLFPYGQVKGGMEEIELYNTAESQPAEETEQQPS